MHSCLASHTITTVKGSKHQMHSTESLVLSSQSRPALPLSLHRKLLMGVDLTKGFYFSFTYHLAATLQCNYQAGLAGAYAAAAANVAAGQGGRPSSTGGEVKYVIAELVASLASQCSWSVIHSAHCVCVPSVFPPFCRHRPGGQLCLGSLQLCRLRQHVCVEQLPHARTAGGAQVQLVGCRARAWLLGPASAVRCVCSSGLVR